MAKDKWVQGMHMKKGALHEMLHVPQGEKIPAKKMAEARNSDNPLERKRAALAHTLESFHK